MNMLLKITIKRSGGLEEGGGVLVKKSQTL
jgi:hypothetical protein